MHENPLDLLIYGTWRGLVEVQQAAEKKHVTKQQRRMKPTKK
jgi:hypothetical protein